MSSRPAIVVVYENVRKLSRWRSIEWSSPELSEKEIRAAANLGLIVLQGSTKNKKKFAVIIIPRGSKYLSSTDQLRNALSQSRITDQDEGFELVLVTFEDIKHAKINVLTAIRDTIKGHIVQVLYKIFMLESPLHVGVAKHEIVDIQTIIDCRIEPSTLANILDTDPQSVWNGIKPGDYVKITHSSPNVGMQIAFRKCIFDDPNDPTIGNDDYSADDD